ncbi:hypothetical protein FRC10_010777 [Ceratobasidium sp. 414]|nr:hypothetical protein FRC10_010777 [Ceratobasidium sp. 414]
MNLTILDYMVCLSALALAVVWLRQRSHTSKLPLPPGPPRWPLIGSLLSLPRDEPNWMAFMRWGKENESDVLYVPVPGDNLVIINSHEAAVELLERRSAVYSDRPRLVMAGDLVGWDQLLGLIPYGNKVKRIRRLLHDGMSLKAMQSWQPLQEQEALRFIQRLLYTPQDLVAHIRQTAGATVVKLTYGYTVHDQSDEHIIAAEQAMESFSLLTAPGAFMVDMFPWLQYVPSASFKKVVAESRRYLVGLVDMPMEFVYKQLETGQAEPSLVSKWLEDLTGEKDYENTVKTVSAITTFFIAMLYNPTAQATAQAEIERVIGTDRLPTYADRDSLPYVEAVYKEVMRWQPIAPLGLPHKHTAEKDDEYRGMRIPANSTIITNIWGILRDPSVYKNPDAFNPDRYIGVGAEPDPEDVVFGFGRRRCPGIHVAQSSVWLSIVLTLASYKITPAVGEDGKTKLPSLQYSNTTISHPPSFQCKITPRSDKIRKLVEDAAV